MMKWTEQMEMKWLGLVLALLWFPCFAADEPAENCTIQAVTFEGEHSRFDEIWMKAVVGKPCDSWMAEGRKLVRFYEDQGFAAAQISGQIVDFPDSIIALDGTPLSNQVLSVTFDRGSAYVWAAAENLDSSGTRPDVFRKLSLIEEGKSFSLMDLERAERRLSRLGYFDQTAPVRLFKDPVRNRLIPAFSMRAAPISQAEALVTYSSENNLWEGHVNVNLFNIMGTARDLQLNGVVGEEKRQVEGSYKEPWIFGTNWNLVARGRFEDIEDDRLVLGEVGITRDIGFDFSIGAYLGMTEDDKHSTLELSYVSLDRFILPRDGWRLQGSVSYKIGRPDSLDNVLQATAEISRYFPLYGNFITRFSGAAGGLFSTDAKLATTDLFALGGLNSFKGMSYQFLRTRTYGLTELAFLWQDGHDLSIEVFYEPGLYRGLRPAHGWIQEHDYGVGFTQYRKNWSFNLYYALRNGCNYLDGILGFGVKTLF